MTVDMNRQAGDRNQQAGWYASTIAEVAVGLDVDVERGLSPDGVVSRRQKYGPNRLSGAKKESGLQAFLRQYQDFMQLVLLAATPRLPSCWPG